jgi:PTS system nitrogen regulatory IIA component
LAILARIRNKGEQLSIQSYIDPKTIIFLDVQTPEEGIVELIHLLKKEGKISNPEMFYQAVLEREKIVSTAIGLGVAVPHAKLDEYNDFFIAIGIQKNRGIAWNAIDGSDVRIIFVIGGPANKQTEYLQILSKITEVIKDEDKRKKILSVKTAEEVSNVFEGC